MTIIIGIEYKDKAYLGSDSAASSEDSTDIIDRSKIIRGSDYMIGYSGTFRLSQILRKMKFSTKKKKDEDWVFLFVDKLKELCKQEECIIEDDGEKCIAGKGELLVCIPGKIYCIQNNFSILRSGHKFHCIGDPAYAYGSLWTTRRLDNPEERIRLAMEASAQFSPRCAPPFYIEVL